MANPTNPQDAADFAALAKVYADHATTNATAAFDGQLKELNTLEAAINASCLRFPKRVWRYDNAKNALCIARRLADRVKLALDAEKNNADKAAATAQAEAGKGTSPNLAAVKAENANAEKAKDKSDKALEDLIKAREAVDIAFRAAEPKPMRKDIEHFCDDHLIAPWLALAACLLIIIFVGYTVRRLSPGGRDAAQIAQLTDERDGLKVQNGQLAKEVQQLKDAKAGMIAGDEKQRLDNALADETKKRVVAEQDRDTAKAEAAKVAPLEAEVKSLQDKLALKEATPAPAANPQPPSAGSPRQQAAQTGGAPRKSDDALLEGIADGSIRYMYRDGDKKSYFLDSNGTKYRPSQVAAYARSKGVKPPAAFRDGVKVWWED